MLLPAHFGSKRSPKRFSNPIRATSGSTDSKASTGDRVEEAVVLRMGDLAGEPAPLVRIHSQCLTGDVFHSLRCDCRAQLELALERIAAGRPRPADLRAPGRPRHRPAQQAARLRAAGPRRRHGGSQRAARLRVGPAQLRAARRDPALLRPDQPCACFPTTRKKWQAVERAGVQVVERVPCLVDVLDTRRSLSAHQERKDGPPDRRVIALRFISPLVRHTNNILWY